MSRALVMKWKFRVSGVRTSAINCTSRVALRQGQSLSVDQREPRQPRAAVIRQVPTASMRHELRHASLPRNSLFRIASVC